MTRYHIFLKSLRTLRGIVPLSAIAICAILILVPRTGASSEITFDETLKILHTNNETIAAAIAEKNRSEEKKLPADEGYALIVLPEGLERKARRGEAPFVVCYNNNQFLMITSIIKSDILKVIQTISEEIRVDYYHQPAQMQSCPVTTDTHALFNPYLNYMYFLLTSLTPAAWS